jgi:hypothetical protein
MAWGDVVSLAPWELNLPVLLLLRVNDADPTIEQPVDLVRNEARYTLRNGSAHGCAGDEV